MILGIIGSRTFTDYDYFKECMQQFNIDNIECVVSGGAIGADSLGERWANENNIPTLIFKPDYKTHGRLATFERNYTIADRSDFIVAFWDGKSRGTKHTLDYAKKIKKQTLCFIGQRGFCG